MSEIVENETTNKNTRVVFNIGGQRHEAFISTLKAVPGIS